MESDKLYRVKKEDLPRLQELLVECFSRDPLYCQLIPDQETRNRLLPELFECDLTEFFETCEIFAESPDMNALLVVSDESEPYNPLTFYLAEAWAGLRTDEYLIKEDPSLKTLWNFVKGRDYLNSRWTDQLHQEERLHVIYLAVRPTMQHHGLAAVLMEEVIAYAQSHHLMVSLETHNPANVPMYEHFGFKIFGIVQKNFDLKQYCMIREFR
nr:GNAT family N-acetyltransferase [uncultured Enterocloster sp.]